MTSQAEWATAAWLPNGFGSGLAKSSEFNKAWRQPSFVASAVSQFIMEALDQDVRDNGDRPVYVAQLNEAVRRVAFGGIVLPDFGQFLRKDGDAMTAGFLTLANHPQLAMHAATRQWVIDEVNRVAGSTGYVAEAPGGDIFYARSMNTWKDISERFLPLIGGTLRAPGGGWDTLMITSPSSISAGLTMRVDGQPAWALYTGTQGNFNIRDETDAVTCLTFFKDSHNIAVRGNDLTFDGPLDVQWLTRPAAHQSLGISRAGGANIKNFYVYANDSWFNGAVSAVGTLFTNHFHDYGDAYIAGGLTLLGNINCNSNITTVGFIHAGTNLSCNQNLTVGDTARIANGVFYRPGTNDPLTVQAQAGFFARIHYFAGYSLWTAGVTPGPDGAFVVTREGIGQALIITAGLDVHAQHSLIVEGNIHASAFLHWAGDGWIRFHSPVGFYSSLRMEPGQGIWCNTFAAYGGDGWIRFNNAVWYAGTIDVAGVVTCATDLRVTGGWLRVANSLEAYTTGGGTLVNGWGCIGPFTVNGDLYVTGWLRVSNSLESYTTGGGSLYNNWGCIGPFTVNGDLNVSGGWLRVFNSLESYTTGGGYLYNNWGCGGNFTVTLGVYANFVYSRGDMRCDNYLHVNHIAGTTTGAVVGMHHHVRMWDGMCVYRVIWLDDCFTGTGGGNVDVWHGLVVRGDWISSDEQFKRNIHDHPITDALTPLRGIRFFDFDRIDGDGHTTGHDNLGFTAQQMQGVIPEVVEEQPVASRNICGPGGSCEVEYVPALVVNKTALTAYLIRALQQLADKIEQLEARGG